MYLDKITIQNFKRIKKRTTFDFSPITILVGPNSSGKSTLLEAINLTKILTEYVFEGSQSASDYLNEISFNDILSSSAKTKKITFEALFKEYITSWEYSREINDYGNDYYDFDDDYTPKIIGWHNLSIKYILRDSKGSISIDEIIINDNNIFDDNAASYWKNKPKNNSFIISLNYRKKIKQQSYTKLPKNLIGSSEEWDKFLRVFEDYGYPKLGQTALFLPEDFHSYFYNVNFKRQGLDFNPIKEKIVENSLGILFAYDSPGNKDPLLDRKVFCNLFNENINLVDELEYQEFKNILDLSEDYFSKLCSSVDKALYYSEIDETRKSPPELYEYHSGIVKNDFYGLMTFMLDSSNGSTKLQQKFFQKLKMFDIADELKIQTIAEINKSRKFYKLLFYWKDNIFYHNKLSSGSKQIIPIILKLIRTPMQMREMLILGIRQPELHLHPKLQMKIADILFERMNETHLNECYIVETHSEHMIKKFQILVANGDMSREDLKIYYFDPVPNYLECNVVSLELNERGMFTKPWPNGFFEESAVLNIQLIEAINNRKN